MRVCRVSQTFPTDKNNGKGLHCYHVSQLQKATTLVITKFYPNENYWETKNNVTVSKVRYWQLPFPKNNKLSVAWMWALLSYFVGQLQQLFRAIPTLLKFKPTITHLQSPHAILIGVFNKLLFNAPIVLTFHGSDLLRIKNNKLYHYLLRAVDTVLYVNSDMHNDLVVVCPKAKLVHTPSGVDLNIFNKDKINPSIKKKQLITIGNLRWQKGQKYLIEAFSLILSSFPDYQLVIIGEGELKKDLIELAHNLGINDKVFFFGRATTEQVKQQLLESELFILSSVTEGMPKALLESLACQVPVVVTKVGACEMLSKGVGISVKPKDSKALSEAIVEMLTDRVAYEEKVNFCKEKVEDYTWQHLSNKVFSEFEELLRK